MKGKTNVYLSKGGGEKLHLTLKTNQSTHTDIIGAVVTVSYDDIVETYTWNDKELVITLPIDIEYTASFSNIEGYKTPDSISYISSIDTNRFITVVYETELVTINVSAEEGDISGYLVDINKITKYEEEYTQIEYIESTGALYIDTGFKPNQDTRVVIKMEDVVASGSHDYYFGARTSTTSKTFCFAYNSSGYYSSGYNTTNGSVDASYTLTGIFTVDKNKNITYINGTLVNSVTYASFTCPINLTIGAINNNGTILYATAKFYSCLIYDNDVLIRDFVPVISSSNVAGLYDKVNKVFYPSSSSTAFNAGNIGKLIATQTTSSVSHKIPYGTVYQVSTSDIAGYQAPESVSFTSNQNSRIIELVYSTRLAAGTTYEFDYTGAVQEVTLPKGSYKLQCWGALGGNVTGTYATKGGKGGYSEGVLTLTEPTTLYAFVGGQGTSYTSSATQTSTSALKGGWNCGGAGIRTSVRGTKKCFPRAGGGATDFATTTSTMSYSSNRTNRSSASLLSRCIVAGGGAGASASYYTTDNYNTVFSLTIINKGAYEDDYWGEFSAESDKFIPTIGETYYADVILNYEETAGAEGMVFNVSIKKYTDSTNYTIESNPFTVTSDTVAISILFNTDYIYYKWYFTFSTFVNTTTTINKTSATSHWGGGVNGNGWYPGKEDSCGSGANIPGVFGKGGSQTKTAYDFTGGGGGAGWWGGGTSYKNGDNRYYGTGSGGSGFVNIAANASYRPTNYTGLELDSGKTIGGDTSFESVSGGTETGHTGNGYARITVL